MNRHTVRVLGAAIALGALLLAGVTAAFASGSTGTLFGRVATGAGPGGMMNGDGSQNMMNGSGSGGMMGGTGGMMGGSGSGGMMGASSGMMGGWSQISSSGKAISIDQARQSVQRYIDKTGNKNLAIDEVLEFQRNFYAIIRDTSTAHGAMEVLVNKSTGAVFPEFGPAMMWNTQYGMMRSGMGGMMGYQQTSGSITVSTAEAEQIAQQWLNQNRPRTTTQTPDQLPGYYTIHFLQNGKIAGMLSVNGYTGQVWYHSWHGKAVRVLVAGG